jgi:hypothetical protein
MTINGDTSAWKAAPSDESRERILDAFRRWGCLQADLDPLGRLRPVPVAVLDAAGEAGSFARRFYCGPIGAEFMHIPDPDKRRWIKERIDQEPPHVESERVLAFDRFRSVRGCHSEARDVPMSVTRAEDRVLARVGIALLRQRLLTSIVVRTLKPSCLNAPVVRSMAAS